jgi:predicted nuclease of predicted toxin-antitoxin system
LASFLIDNNLPPSLVEWLNERGREATHVKSVGLADASDNAVWEYAQKHSLSIITKDTDFDRLALQALKLNAPVFRLVIGNATRAQLFSWLESRFQRLGGGQFASKLRPDLTLIRLVIVE